MENIKDPILQIQNVSISYTGKTLAVKNVSADVEKNTITAIMGPSGCGKSTLLRAVNRMHELYKNINVTGKILLRVRYCLTARTYSKWTLRKNVAASVWCSSVLTRSLQ